MLFKNRNKRIYPNQTAIKIEQHPTQQNPDEIGEWKEAEIGEWKEGYWKSCKEVIILSRLRIGHTDITHSYLLKQKQPPWCVGCHTPYSGKHLLIDKMDLTPKRHYFYTVNNITIWTCWRRQNTNISKNIRFIYQNLNFQYFIYVHDANTRQPNQQ